MTAARAATEHDRRHAGSLLAAAVAFRLFGTLVPLLFLMVMVFRYFRDLSDVAAEGAARRIGMVGYIVDPMLDAPGPSRAGGVVVVVLGVIFLLLAAPKLADTLRTANSLAWDMPARRWRRRWLAGLAVLGFLVVAILLLIAIDAAKQEALWVSGPSVVGTFVAVGSLWLLASRLLPHGDAEWRDLVPGAVLVGAGMVLVNLVMAFFVWRATSLSSLYGPPGLVLGLFIWLFIVSRVLVLSAAVNADQYQRRTGIVFGPARPLLEQSEQDEPGSGEPPTDG
ncbi:MAG TPA: YhjD/YihY/BrkB family envelope integrity protein [Thermoleophilia bacterium]|nr:YhjD/YihY/BrkB family envelope integrity protein [Thermoleophilia bacterium]